MEKFWDLLKRAQRKWYFADYADQEQARAWKSQPLPKGIIQFSFPLPLPSLDHILVFKPDEIGDAVLALPALRQLRNANPQSRIYVLCQEKTRSIFERVGVADEVVGFTARTRFRKWNRGNISEALTRFSRGSFSIAIFLKTYPQYFRNFLKIPANIHWHPQDPRMNSRSVYQVPVSLWGAHRAHQVKQMLEIVAPLTRGEGDESFPAFRWNEDDKKFAGEMPTRYFVVHPFSTGATRQYPISYWKPVIESLQKQLGIPAIIVGSKDDVFEPIEGSHLWLGKLTMGQLGYTLSQALAFVGCLSGPAHWAAALGKKTAVLMSGHSLASEWAPLGNTLLLNVQVPCSPCHLRECYQFDLACLKELTPERVLPHLKSFLSPRLQPRENSSETLPC